MTRRRRGSIRDDFPEAFGLVDQSEPGEKPPVHYVEGERRGWEVKEEDETEREDGEAA
jgi:hypothetical protein